MQINNEQESCFFLIENYSLISFYFYANFLNIYYIYIFTAFYIFLVESLADKFRLLDAFTSESFSIRLSACPTTSRAPLHSTRSYELNRADKASENYSLQFFFLFHCC